MLLGYGFAIGNVAAFDAANPKSVVSPGGVGFDINCGVRLIRTNLTEADVEPVKEKLAQALFDHIPVGVGSQGILPCSPEGLRAVLLRARLYIFFCNVLELFDILGVICSLTFLHVKPNKQFHYDILLRWCF